MDKPSISSNLYGLDQKANSMMRIIRNFINFWQMEAQPTNTKCILPPMYPYQSKPFFTSPKNIARNSDYNLRKDKFLSILKKYW